MKKIIYSLLILLLTLVFVPYVNAKEKVPVYMITKNGCSACKSAKEYFTSLAVENPDLFELIDMELFDANWNFTSDDAQNMFFAVYEKIGEDSSSAATPTIIIGDYHTVGLPQDTTEVYNAIVAARDAKEKVDIIKDIADDLNIDVSNISKETTSTTNSTSGKYDVLVVIGIFVILIGGFAGLVIAGKK